MKTKITITMETFNKDQETELLVDAIKAVVEGKEHHHDIHKNPNNKETYGYFVNVIKEK